LPGLSGLKIPVDLYIIIKNRNRLKRRFAYENHRSCVNEKAGIRG
jgi:hypothetical protein